MDALTLARLQFGITTVYHFFFVPLTLGLSILVAVMQTIYVVKGDEKYKDMAKFWGKLLLINFAMGVVTGIVQEFQFGMNWSEYSRFVGDIFGAPLAIEALVAFFIEFDLPRRLDFRLGQAVQARPPRRDLAGRHCRQRLGVLDFGRQCLHAESGRLYDRCQWSRRDDRFLRLDQEP